MERLRQRDLLTGDILHVLKNGFVYDEPEESTQLGLFKYRMEAGTPNSGNRTVRVVIVPDDRGHVIIKVITVMWVGEKQ